MHTPCIVRLRHAVVADDEDAKPMQTLGRKAALLHRNRVTWVFQELLHGNEGQ
jgi:hypothetical protein